VDVLAAGANEGSLNHEELSEYESLINAADFVAVLKMKVARRLQAIPKRD